MSLFSRVLRSGEGKKVKALEALVPDINAVAERFAAMDDDGLRAMTGSSGSASTEARKSTTSSSRRSVWSGRPRGGLSGSGTTTFR